MWLDIVKQTTNIFLNYEVLIFQKNLKIAEQSNGVLQSIMLIMKFQNEEILKYVLQKV